jgi:hypothetical protein
MILRNRVIWSDNGVLKDVSETLNNHISGTLTLPLVAAEDYLFLGADAPFNHRWVEVSTVNAQAAKIDQISIWDGNDWRATAEVIDGTLNSAGTVGFAQSGRIAWVPDKDVPGWARDHTSDTSGHVITGLSSIKVYDLFWARLRFSADLTAGTTLKFLGYKFANDEDLYDLWPEFDTTEARTRFKSGTTTFNLIHFEAAKQVIRDMKSEKVLSFEGQILEWEVLRLPAVHKAAELIYNAYGSDFKDELIEARTRYKESMKVELFNVDRNQNASLDVHERSHRVGSLYR